MYATIATRRYNKISRCCIYYFVGKLSPVGLLRLKGFLKIGRGFGLKIGRGAPILAISFDGANIIIRVNTDKKYSTDTLILLRAIWDDHRNTPVAAARAVNIYLYIRLFLTQLRFARYMRDARGMVRRVYTATRPNRRITESAEFARAARVSAW